MQDADADPTNELINSAALNGNNLEITDAGGTTSIDLGSLNPAELDPQVDDNITTNYLPKWDGTALVQSSSVFEDGNGNVGIGTTTPNGKLEIENTNDSADDNYLLVLHNKSIAAGSNALISFSGSTAENGTGGFNPAVFGHERGVGFVWKETGGSGAPPVTMRLRNGNMNIKGNIGIGTTSTAVATSKLEIANIGSLNGQKLIGFGEGSGPEFWFGSGFLPAGQEKYLSFSTNINGSDEDIMVWKGNGNVGIGLTDPAFKLDVVGDIQGAGFLQLLKPGASPIGSELLLGSPGGGLGLTYRLGDGTQGGSTTRFDTYINSGGTFIMEPAGLRGIAINQLGDVGIGLTDPQSKVHIKGSAGLAEHIALIENTDAFGRGLRDLRARWASWYVYANPGRGRFFPT